MNFSPAQKNLGVYDISGLDKSSRLLSSKALNSLLGPTIKSILLKSLHFGLMKLLFIQLQKLNHSNCKSLSIRFLY
jgi:hypothetical protein